jgi:hypothetical protein
MHATCFLWLKRTLRLARTYTSTHARRHTHSPSYTCSHAPSQSLFSRYVHGSAWALSQMTGMGLQIPNPRTAWEKLFTMTVNVVGFTLYASVAGNLMATIAVVDEDILAFREKMKSVSLLVVVAVIMVAALTDCVGDDDDGGLGVAMMLGV